MYLSGRGSFVAEQVRSLRSAGVTVEVIFFDPKKTRLQYGVSIPRIARALASRKYDIVHTHHTYTMVQVDLAKRFTGSLIPVVLTTHEPEIVDRQGTTKSWHPSSRLRHALWVKRYAARRADFMIYVYRGLADILAVDRPHEIIPCGIDLAKFRPLDRAESRRQLGLPAEVLVVFFPGDPKRRAKRFALALQVLDRVKRQRPEAVMLTGGGIPLDSMPLYYNAADVMLQTSWCEASPSAVKEALACEIPVVATDAGDTRETIEGVPHCWICSDDPVELATRVLEASGHRAEGGRQRMIEHGFGLEQVALRLIAVYERLLADSPAA